MTTHRPAATDEGLRHEVVRQVVRVTCRCGQSMNEHDFDKHVFAAIREIGPLGVKLRSTRP